MRYICRRYLDTGYYLRYLDTGYTPILYNRYDYELRFSCLISSQFSDFELNFGKKDSAIRKKQLERTRSCKVRNEIGKIEVETFEPKLESSSWRLNWKDSIKLESYYWTCMLRIHLNITRPIKWMCNPSLHCSNQIHVKFNGWTASRWTCQARRLRRYQGSH